MKEHKTSCSTFLHFYLTKWTALAHVHFFFVLLFTVTRWICSQNFQSPVQWFSLDSTSTLPSWWPWTFPELREWSCTQIPLKQMNKVLIRVCCCCCCCSMIFTSSSKSMNIGVNVKIFLTSLCFSFHRNELQQGNTDHSWGSPQSGGKVLPSGRTFFIFNQ